MRWGGLAAAVAAAMGCAAIVSAVPAGAASRMIFPLSFKMIASHNEERARHGVPGLRWDPRLAQAADAYAAELARTGRWGHSHHSTRPGQGENLWMGTRGAFTFDEMVNGWLSERSMYRAGIFPNVTRTRNWSDVGHYSQIIWRGTTAVGCAIRSSRSNDYLVCRYNPTGNVMGQRVS